MMVSEQFLNAVVKRHWGYDSLRPLQAEAMSSVIEGRDSLVVLPTGGGKSLCFQAPALASDGMALVVSPLISLMKDQVDSLEACGVSARCLNSSLSPAEKRQVHDAIQRGSVKLLYVAPERAVTPAFIDYLKSVRLCFVVIDEAHCISHWGHDFRPEYRALRTLREAFPDLPFHAYTATATRHVRDDICKELALNNPEVLVGTFDRPNLVFHVERTNGILNQVQDVIERHRGDSGIIYCITRKKVDKLCQQLRDKGYAALPYHAGMDDEQRKANQEAFSQETIDIIVATVAFGMGIDKPDVRYVIHTGMPKSLEHYQQESGRAGRDGLEAECRLFYSGADYSLWQFLLKQSEGESTEIAQNKLRDMCDYCAGVTCRHQTIATYFGQDLGKDNCGACDLCLGKADLLADALTVGQKILSCVVRLGRFAGPSYTTLVLAGSREARVVEKGHDKLSTWGILADCATRDVRDWIEQLVVQDHLTKVGEYNVLEITEKGRRLLRGEHTPRLLKPASKTRKQKKSAASAKSWDGVDRALFDVLREKRRDIARERNKPAFVVFTDAALRDMARKKPCTEFDFIRVHGVGEKKCRDFADLFLPLIQDHLAGHGVDPVTPA